MELTSARRNNRQTDRQTDRQTETNMRPCRLLQLQDLAKEEGYERGKAEGYAQGRREGYAQGRCDEGMEREMRDRGPGDEAVLALKALAEGF